MRELIGAILDYPSDVIESIRLVYTDTGIVTYPEFRVVPQKSGQKDIIFYEFLPPIEIDDESKFRIEIMQHYFDGEKIGLFPVFR